MFPFQENVWQSVAEACEFPRTGLRSLQTRSEEATEVWKPRPQAPVFHHDRRLTTVAAP